MRCRGKKIPAKKKYRPIKPRTRTHLLTKEETQSAVTITKDEITAVIVAKIKKKRDNNEKIGQLLKT